MSTESNAPSLSQKVHQMIWNNLAKHEVKLVSILDDLKAITSRMRESNLESGAVERDIEQIERCITSFQMTASFYLSMPNVMGSSSAAVVRNVSTVQPLVDVVSREVGKRIVHGDPSSQPSRTTPPPTPTASSAKGNKPTTRVVLPRTGKRTVQAEVPTASDPELLTSDCPAVEDPYEPLTDSIKPDTRENAQADDSLVRALGLVTGGLNDGSPSAYSTPPPSARTTPSSTAPSVRRMIPRRSTGSLATPATNTTESHSAYTTPITRGSRRRLLSATSKVPFVGPGSAPPASSRAPSAPPSPRPHTARTIIARPPRRS